MLKKKTKMIAAFGATAAAGIGLGMLLAPKSGKETREDLKKKIETLRKKAKDIDLEDVKQAIEEKIDMIETELKELDKEKVIKFAREKAKKIESDFKDLAKYAKQKSEPVLSDAVEAVRRKATEVTKQVLNKLEKEKE